MRKLLDPLAGLESVHVGHDEVHQDDVEPLPGARMVVVEPELTKSVHG